MKPISKIGLDFQALREKLEEEFLTDAVEDALAMSNDELDTWLRVHGISVRHNLRHLAEHEARKSVSNEVAPVVPFVTHTQDAVTSIMQYLVGALRSDPLVAVAALSAEFDTADIEVRIAELDQAILDRQMPWGEAIFWLIRDGGNRGSHSKTSYRGIVGAKDSAPDQRGALRVELIASDGRKADLCLDSHQTSGRFEGGEFLEGDWTTFVLKIMIEGMDDRDSNSPS